MKPNVYRNFKFQLTLTKNENKLSQIAYSNIKQNENKALWSKKNQKLIGTDRIRRALDESTLCGHNNRKYDQATTSGCRSTRWLSEINNDTRKDASQSNKMRTYRLFKKIDNYKCEDYFTNTRHWIALTKLRLSNHKLAIDVID